MRLAVSDDAGGSDAMRVGMRCRTGVNGKGGQQVAGGEGGNREQDAVTHVREILSRPPGNITRYSIVGNDRVAEKTQTGIRNVCWLLLYTRWLNF